MAIRGQFGKSYGKGALPLMGKKKKRKKKKTYSGGGKKAKRKQLGY